MRADFPMERTYLHGNNKTPWELELALEAGIGRIVLDNEREMALLQADCRGARQVQDVLLRVTPGIKPQTHSYIQTGQIDSKFGLGISTGCAMRGLRTALALPNLQHRRVALPYRLQHHGARFLRDGRAHDDPLCRAGARRTRAAPSTSSTWAAAWACAT